MAAALREAAAGTPEGPAARGDAVAAHRNLEIVLADGDLVIPRHPLNPGNVGHVYHVGAVGLNKQVIRKLGQGGFSAVATHQTPTGKRALNGAGSA